MNWSRPMLAGVVPKPEQPTSVTMSSQGDSGKGSILDASPASSGLFSWTLGRNCSQIQHVILDILVWLSVSLASSIFLHTDFLLFAWGGVARFTCGRLLQGSPKPHICNVLWLASELHFTNFLLSWCHKLVYAALGCCRLLYPSFDSDQVPRTLSHMVNPWWACGRW